MQIGNERAAPLAEGRAFGPAGFRLLAASQCVCACVCLCACVRNWASLKTGPSLGFATTASFAPASSRRAALRLREFANFAPTKRAGQVEARER